MKNKIIKELKCDLCGEALVDTNHIGVISADETLCLHCFRQGDENNYGKIVELNAENYSLKYQLNSSEKEKRKEFNRGFYHAKRQYENNADEYKKEIIELIEKYYLLALKTESSTAIELISKLKDEQLVKE